jgi:hypothetical protein
MTGNQNFCVGTNREEQLAVQGPVIKIKNKPSTPYFSQELRPKPRLLEELTEKEQLISLKNKTLIEKIDMEKYLINCKEK